ncbi:Uncharacterised protein [Achromobacter xylosoxidans]|nr:Uncharacterised protein [Achromobacter xylosoxidans]
MVVARIDRQMGFLPLDHVMAQRAAQVLDDVGLQLGLGVFDQVVRHHRRHGMLVFQRVVEKALEQPRRQVRLGLEHFFHRHPGRLAVVDVQLVVQHLVGLVVGVVLRRRGRDLGDLVDRLGLADARQADAPDVLDQRAAVIRHVDVLVLHVGRVRDGLPPLLHLLVQVAVDLGLALEAFRFVEVGSGMLYAGMTHSVHVWLRGDCRCTLAVQGLFT